MKFFSKNKQHPLLISPVPAINFSKFAAKGDFSYGVYLYGWPVQQLVMYYFMPDVSPITIFITSTVILWVLRI